MSLRARLQAAWTDLQQGRAQAAADALSTILAEHPGQTDALQLLAGAALALKRPEQAAAALRQALAILPDRPELLYNLGIAERDRGDHAAALAAFQDCLARRPDLPEARLGVAEAALATGQAGLAVSEYRAVLARQPLHTAAADGLLLALAAAGEGSEAEAQARAALARQPQRAESWRLLAQVLEKAARKSEALAALAEGEATLADPYPLQLARGHLHFRSGHFLAAAAAFAAAAAQHPDSTDAWNNLATCQVLLNRTEEAIAAARRALALSPQAAGVRLTLAAALSRSREPAELDEALALCRQLLAQHPQLAGAHDCAAAVLGKQGQFAPALEHARRAVALEPQRHDYAVTLARVLEDSGDLAAAEAALDPHAQHADAPAPILRQIGHVRLRRGRQQQALTALDAAWRRDPDDQNGIAERALALAAMQDWPAAEQWLGLHELIRPVPIAVPPAFDDLHAFLRALADDIRGHSRLRYEPVGLVARGGYLTGELLADDTPAITGFGESLRQAIAGFIAGLPDVPGHPFLGRVPRGEHLLHVWATRVREQGVIDSHLHEGSWLSGAYYVELPPALGEDGAGWLEFGQSVPGLPSPPAQRFLRIRPELGQMWFFPSYLYHRTLPYSGDGERISISFDLGPV